MAIRPRSIGEILDGAMRLYAQDVGLYMVTAIVAAIPVGAVMVLALVSGGSTQAAIGVLLFIPIALVAAISIWTALLLQMNERLEGREPSVGPSVRRALGLFFRVVWAGIIAYVVLVGAIMLGALGVGIVVALGAPFLPEMLLAVLTIALAIAVCLLIGLRVFAGLYLFLPGVTVEGLSGYGSIKRGFQLAKGGQGRILAVVTVSWLLVAVPVAAVYFVTGTTAMFLDPNALANGTISTGQLVVQQFLLVLASGFSTPYLVACILLLYFDQRIRLEAYDLQSEAEALAS